MLTAVYVICGLVILAESLNKLERTSPLADGLDLRQRASMWLKAAAWSCMAVGSAGAIVTPLLPLERPPVQDVLMVLGCAVLIIRTRVKEG